MPQEQEAITIHFNLDNEMDKRIFSGIKRIPKSLGIDDLSKAFIHFMNDLFLTLIECEEKRAECENMLNHFLGNGVRH